MGLQLKHIAPYLPYGLNIANKSINKSEGILSIYKIEINNNNDRGIENVLFGANQIPILRPLSDLTKEIEHKGEKFIPIDYFEIGDDDNETYEYDNGNINLIQDLEYLSANRLSLDIVFIPYGVIQKLLEWHFDVFGLIEKNLAIDINAL